MNNWEIISFIELFPARNAIKKRHNLDVFKISKNDI